MKNPESIIKAFANALHRISLASQNSMSSKEECGRIARETIEAWQLAERERAEADVDDEPEVVSYIDSDWPVIESRYRIAVLSRRGHELWHLYMKKRKARSAALSDWDSVDLTTAQKGTTSEARATKWVVDGKWGEP